MNKKYVAFISNLKWLERSKRKSKLLLLAVSCTLIISGCQSGANHSNIENNQVVDSSSSDNNANTQEESNLAEATPSVVDEQSMIQFSDLSKYQFVFSSGAGAWQTMLNISEDGTFNGYYSDSNMGDSGEDYPNGTKYSSTFEGEFTTPKRVNEYTYSMSVKSIKLEKEVGSEEIIDGIKYIYSEPHGLADAKEIHIYTNKAPIKELPEGFRSWVGYMELSDINDEYLPFYGLYNLATESGFSSYVIDDIEEVNNKLDIVAEIAEIEKQYDILNNRLKNDDLNQSELNFLAKDIYVLWDDEINKIWSYLKETLNKDEMANLTSQQREWITIKENEVKEASSEYEGGSMRPMIEYLKGAELTKDRVYELIEYLK